MVAKPIIWAALAKKLTARSGDGIAKAGLAWRSIKTIAATPAKKPPRDGIDALPKYRCRIFRLAG
jgi:hypothetical protein